MKTEQQLRKAIMRRVYGVYVLRRLSQPAVRLAVFLGICFVIASSVSMPNVIANALNTNDLVTFFLVALTNTKVYVQLGVLLAGLVVVWTVFDVFRPHSHAEFYA